MTTAPTPGAVAIVQLHGEGVHSVLEHLTGRSHWPVTRMMFVDFSGIDSGLAVMLRSDWAQVMPHGGPRVVRKLIDALLAAGCVFDETPEARIQYPEAASALEADMLMTLAKAASPVAIDLLLRQVENWHDFMQKTPPLDDEAVRHLLARSSTLDRLIAPASVVVIGQPNVGKSTLTNRMLGRAASIVADLPGTTRDWVAGLAELPPGVAVRWMDTPGLRESDDAIEQRAIELANQVIREAEVVVAMRDPVIGWPDPMKLPREPDLWVMNKCDLAGIAKAQRDGDGLSPQQPRAISADTGLGIDALHRDILAKLDLLQIDQREVWAFSDSLRESVKPWDAAALRDYAAANR